MYAIFICSSQSISTFVKISQAQLDSKLHSIQMHTNSHLIVHTLFFIYL